MASTNRTITGRQTASSLAATARRLAARERQEFRGGMITCAQVMGGKRRQHAELFSA
jgi:hypothetical protein